MGEFKMIGSAVQKGNLVYVYNEKGNTLFSKAGQLIGYTGSTVSVKSGNIVYTYDDRGNTKFAKNT